MKPFVINENITGEKIDNLKDNTKKISDLERDIYDIKTLDDFSEWIEKAKTLTSNVFGESSEQCREVTNTIKHYQLLPPNNDFDLKQAQSDAFKIIAICEGDLV